MFTKIIIINLSTIICDFITLLYVPNWIKQPICLHIFRTVFIFIQVTYKESVVTI